jgi:hypothetical protein
MNGFQGVCLSNYLLVGYRFNGSFATGAKKDLFVCCQKGSEKHRYQATQFAIGYFY